MSTTAIDTDTLPRTPWNGHADERELEHWASVARTVAQALAVDALARDAANQDPFSEVGLLRDSGLLNLLVPAESGGAGGHWESAFAAVRIIAAADGSIAQLLAYHYANQSSIAFYADPATQGTWFARSAAAGWLWGDSVNPVDPDLSLAAVDEGYRLNGLKRFSTGSSVGDVIVVNAAVSGGTNDGKVLAFVLERTREGLELLGDWDHLGQRLSASGSVKYHDVLVTPEDVLGEITPDPIVTLLTPGLQLAFGNFYLGIAEGALAAGRKILLERKNSWFLSAAGSYAQDPIFQRTIGELKARTAAVGALAEKLNRRFDTEVGRAGALDAAQRGDVAVAIAELKVVATEVALEVANRIDEVTGASSTGNDVGLDLFWRNVRTHSLHDPVDYKKIEVGQYFLHGTNAPLSLYT
ncbi:acyl-CoA dehydrogenase family protein [Paeniglutamicibacter psychrophenolicus]|uniref:acyl-CoA dehydrogenase family protein n=1 Tax=Paeniglutamicibacter psychrophenolicus TaxID=257454 RepID=UPI00278A814A|nr:acyl-CoA dehydrogenase family protein [Paeniglutamicibacter psychrophenolicus]MDQ0093255.1 alkylation response protein AidB-like acyl-CoA dehydrogenase [Paeniglutamicibacter psychrophenolicus]